MRLFVAVEIPEALRLGMVDLQDRLRRDFPSGAGRVRWVPGSRMHLTLAFLGEVAEARLPDLRAVLAEAAHDHAGFETTTTAVGGFPSLTHPRVLFLGLAPCRALEILATDLQVRLGAAGFHSDLKPFRPHLTLARLAGVVHFAAECEYPLVLPLPATEMMLVRSHLPPVGRYETLDRWRLGA